jgi:hypothetical protein
MKNQHTFAARSLSYASTLEEIAPSVLENYKVLRRFPKSPRLGLPFSILDLVMPQTAREMATLVLLL